MTRLQVVPFLFSMLSFVSAFVENSRWGIAPQRLHQHKTSSTGMRMFDPKPLSEDEPASPPDASSSPSSFAEGEETEAVKAVYKNLARGGRYEEVKWVDPAMTANTNPFAMSWWAYILLGFPALLLADDAFHFLPNEGPLAFLKSI